MFDWKYARNGALAAILVGATAWSLQATKATETKSEPAWSFDMWCLEMQLYPARRCDARMPEDLQEYAKYRQDVEKYNEQEQAQAKRDQEILQRLNQNLPGANSSLNQ